MSALIDIERKVAGSGIPILDKVLVVDAAGKTKAGKSYTTIEAALAYANALTIGSTAGVLIWVRSGNYTPDNSGGVITINPRISIFGEDALTTFITPGTNTTNLFTSAAGGAVTIKNLSFLGCTSCTALSFVASSGADSHVIGCRFISASVGVSQAGGSTVYVRECYSSTSATCWSNTGTGTLVVQDCHDRGTTAKSHIINSNGSKLYIFGGSSISSAYVLDHDGDSSTQTVMLNHFSDGATVYANIDDEGNFYRSGCVNVNCTTGLTQDNAENIYSVGCVDDKSKINIANATRFFISGLDFKAVPQNQNGIIEKMQLLSGTSGTIDSSYTNILMTSTTTGSFTLESAISGSSAALPVKIYIVNASSAPHQLVRAGADTINGSSTNYIVPAYTSVFLYGYGTTWFVG